MALIDVYIDGTNVTDQVQEGSVTHRLNRPAAAVVRVPSELTAGTDKSRLKIVLNGTIDFHGTVEGPAAIEDSGDTNNIWTQFQAMSPLYLTKDRRAMDADGDYSKPTFIEDFVTGPKICEAILQHTISQIGPFGMSLGSFASGGTDLRGAPTNFPMMCDVVIGMMTETGECDVVETFIDSGGNMSRLDGYNGNYGADRSGSVSFEFATGAHNAIECRRTVNKQGVANRIRYLFGPKKSTRSDPKAAQHWWGSLDRTSVARLPASWLSVGEPARAQSELDYGIREDTHIFDAQTDEEAIVGYPLYVARWVADAWLRLKPQTLHHLTPEPGILPAFREGDRIHVAAGPRFRGGFDGVQRVMEYTYRFNKNGVVELGAPVGQSGAAALTTTADAEAP